MPSSDDDSKASAAAPPPDSRKFVHGAGYFVSVAVGAALVTAVLWRGGAPTDAPGPVSDDAATGAEGAAAAPMATSVTAAAASAGATASSQ